MYLHETRLFLEAYNANEETMKAASLVEKFFVQKRLEETQTQSKITDSFKIDQLILK